MSKGSKIHFMGIGGSGISAVALYAKSNKYIVSGCDINIDTAYTNNLKTAKIKLYKGHSDNHLKDIDFLITSPSVLFQNSNNPEVVLAKQKNILLTWEKFLGEYLQKNKKVICISGTHGKSTTTAMAGLLLEEAGYDPSVILGATIKEWNSNTRIGKGKIFITEADEFYDNFLNYHPGIIILNNIEYDHPDFFGSYDEVIDSFSRFIKNLVGDRILIFNQDSPGIKMLFKILGKEYLNTINLIGYTMTENPIIKTKKSLYAKIIRKNSESTGFSVNAGFIKYKEDYLIHIPGKFNVYNTLGIIALGITLGIKTPVIRKGLVKFKGIKRRLEFLGEKRGIKVYDDYAHHPTAVKMTLTALRQLYPTSEIIAIIEPHSFSRTKALLSGYKEAFNDADKLIVGPIFKARDNQTFSVSGQSIVDVSGHKRAIYLDSLDKIMKLIKEEANKEQVIIVMGAGDSYKWSRTILKNL